MAARSSPAMFITLGLVFPPAGANSTTSSLPGLGGPRLQLPGLVQLGSIAALAPVQNVVFWGNSQPGLLPPLNELVATSGSSPSRALESLSATESTENAAVPLTMMFQAT